MLKDLLEQMELEAEPGKKAHSKKDNNALLVDNNFIAGQGIAISNAVFYQPPHASLTISGSETELEFSGDGATIIHKDVKSGVVTKFTLLDMLNRIKELERKLDEQAFAASHSGQEFK